MNIFSKFEFMVSSILDIYGGREAHNIVKIIFEDAFNLQHNSKTKFPEKFDDRFDEILIRLKKNEPFQYILGEADFYGLKFKVNDAVLIPRQETEELVFDLVQYTKGMHNIKVLDIGTGSGCLAITLAKELPDADVFAIDISKKALVVAQENAEMNQVNVSFFQKDILDSRTTNFLLEKGLFDIIVSNPPYIPVEESTLMRKNVLDFEPAIALFVENSDPIIFYTVIGKLASQSLVNTGLLAFEINEFLGQQVCDILTKLGYQNIEIVKDMQGKDRIVKGTWISKP